MISTYGTLDEGGWVNWTRGDPGDKLGVECLSLDLDADGDASRDPLEAFSFDFRQIRAKTSLPG